MDASKVFEKNYEENIKLNFISKTTHCFILFSININSYFLRENLHCKNVYIDVIIFAVILLKILLQSFGRINCNMLNIIYNNKFKLL